MAAGSAPVVLVVDDDHRNRQLAVFGLSASGWTVIEAGTGVEALLLIEQRRPGVVVLDVQMPGVDGLEVLRRLRGHRDKAIARTWVLAATALAMQGDRQRCLAAGANDYLSRPFTFKELRARIQAALDQQRAGSAE